MSAAIGWGALAGILSTVVMDASHGILKKSGITGGLEPQLLGRWFRGIARFRFVSADILSEARQPGELPVAVVAHYSIGATFGIVWSLIAHSIDGAGGRFAGGLVFGFATNVAPWLLMFPAMGFGFFGSRGPADRKLLLTSTLNHVMFGVGLGLFAVLLPL